MRRHQLSRGTWRTLWFIAAVALPLMIIITGVIIQEPWLTIAVFLGETLIFVAMFLTCETLRWPRSWEEQLLDIENRGHEVVTHFKPDYRFTRPETIYEDQLLIISCPNDKGQVSVDLKLGGEELRVFARHLITDKLVVYRRGRWETYLRHLAKSAERCRQQRLRDKEVKNMGVVDDTSIFSR